MFFLLQSSLLLASFISSTDTSVELNITNISEARGVVRISVFANAADFDADRNAVFADAITLTSKQPVQLEIPVDSRKTYGIGLYHDVNNNGKLDTNALGIPTEPYAFSNNPAAKWQAPTFADIAFVPGKNTQRSLNLKLLRWRER